MGVNNHVIKMTYQVLPIAFAAMEPDIMVIQLWFLPFKAKLTMRLFESALSWFSIDHQTVFSGWLSRDVGNLYGLLAAITEQWPNMMNHNYADLSALAASAAC